MPGKSQARNRYLERFLYQLQNTRTGKIITAIKKEEFSAEEVIKENNVFLRDNMTYQWIRV